MSFASRFAVVSFLALLLIPIVASAAQDRPGVVNGHVIDAKDGQPLGLVQVELFGTSFVSVTDDAGAFQILNVPAGAYVLQAAAVGYRVIRQNFSIAAEETRTFDVVLTSSTTVLTDSTSVTANAFNLAADATASGFTLDGDERKNLGSVLGDDPLRAVQGLPGVTSNDDFSSAFSVRGASFDRVGLYLDGILLHSPFHTTDGDAANGSLTVFNGDLTDEMTLYQGAWPVRYANRTAGILAVDTRPGSREGVHGQVTASASNAGLQLEGPLGASKRGSWVAAVRKSYLQYILNRIDFGDSAPIAFAFKDAQARADYDLTPRHTLNLTYLDGSSDVDRSRYHDELGPTTMMTSGSRFTLVNAGSRYAREHVLITNHLAWSREVLDVGNRDHLVLSDELFRSWTWRGDASVFTSKRQTLEFGGQVEQVRQSGASNQLVYAPSLTTVVDSFSGTGREIGAYVQESLTFGRARLTGGARQDTHSLSTSSVTTPYASLSLDPSAKTHVQFDWGKYAQFPEVGQYRSTFAQGNLDPERATHYELAVERKLDDRTRLRVEIYDRQDRDMLARPDLDPRLASDGTLVDAVPAALILNSARGYSRGVETFLQRRSANGFTGWVSYAYERTLVTDNRLGLTFPSDSDQRHTVNAYLSRRVRPTVNISGRFAYGSGMPLPGFYTLANGNYELAPNRNTLRSPAYQRTDVRLNKAYVHQKLNTTLYAEIVNVTNHTNRNFDSAGPYDPATRRNTPNFYSMFPILPSVGMVLAF